MSNNIATKLEAILAAKGDIKSAIEAKGVTVGNASLDQYANKIGQIEGGAELPEKDVNFYDYDGTRIASYTIAEAKALSALPTPPTHEGLTFQEWNWTLADIQGYQRKYIDIGANYATNDGKCWVRIDLPEDGLKFSLLLKQTVTRRTIVDWGDGTSDEYFTNNDGGNASLSHTYSTKGKYIIKIYKKDGTGTFTPTLDETWNNYVYEINLSSEIYGTGGGSGLYARVSVPKTLTRFIPKFTYWTTPQVTIPKNSDWNAIGINSNAIYVNGVVCTPPSIPLAAYNGWFWTSADKLIIPEFTTSGSSSNTAFYTSAYTKVLSLSSNLAWTSQITNSVYFSSQGALQEIEIVQGWIPSHNIGFTTATAMLPSAWEAFFTKLGTLEEGVTRTISLGTTILNKLSADQKAIATNKGYTLA